MPPETPQPMVSRRGLLPRRHVSGTPPPDTAPSYPTDLPALVRCLRREVATDDEGVADVDCRAEHHQQRERQQQSGDEHRAVLTAKPSPDARVHGELSPTRLR